MMDKDKILQQLMGTFLGELEERTRSLNRDLLALERQPDGPQRGELFKNIFREAHSLKSAARAVNLQAIEQLSHRLEDLLSAVCDDQVPLTPKILSFLFDAVDALDEARGKLCKGQPLADDAFDGLGRQLQQAANLQASWKVPAAVQAQPTHSTPTEATAASIPAAAAKTTAPPENLTTSASMGDGSAESSLRNEETAASATHTRSPLPARQKTAATTMPAQLGISTTVRVAEEKLDKLLAQTGELLVARQRVEARPADLETLREYVVAWKSEWRGVDDALRRLSQSVDSPSHNASERVGNLPSRVTAVLGKVGDRLRRMETELEHLAREMVGDVRQLGHACSAVEEEVHRIRMLPFAGGNVGLERAVRDLARSTGKEVTLTIEGGDIEVDRSVLEGLADPLLHLVRNSVDHGIEPPDQRRQTGKPPGGKITVAVVLRGSQIDVVISDDGRGLDLNKIRDKARRMNLPEAPDDRELVRRIFLPGFSTASIITDVSGRGIGLDVVKNHVESLHGTIEVASQPGLGTRFTLTVPVTLTTISALLLISGKQIYAVASTNVHSVVRFGTEDVRSVQGRDMLLHGEAPVPIASLAQSLGLPANGVHRDKALGVILSAGEQRLVFVVDDVLTEREIVVKNLGPRVRKVRYVSGATLLPSGRIALVLNAGNVIRKALSGGPTSTTVGTFTSSTKVAKKRLLTVDDSVTTRSLIKSILEAAGYEVTVAVDGQDAWQRLQEAEIDLVVSDVEMPRMNGFELAEAIRGSSRLVHLPVILVTGRETEQDKIRGIEAGANAYLVKSLFDQTNLLETISQLL